ncbi:MAG: J domain-containing protein [Alphaproteobacteria bacterium]|nr:J domain-containing protein [Alphaproteobacteria bacterium]
MRNPYDVLGLPRTASLADIKKKYRALAKENHPDRKPGDKAAAERFKEVNAAYDIIGDEVKRARFDKGEIDADGRERVHAGFHPGAGRTSGFQGFPGSQGRDPRFEDFGMSFNFDDLFSAFRGGGAGAGAGAFRQAQAEPSTSGEFEMDVEFLDAAGGSTKRITVDGRSFDVSIPAGVDAGQTIRMRDKDVDLRIVVTVKPHPFFTRKGDDIHLDLPVTVAEAVRGAKVEVPTVHGSVTLNIPPGSNTGTLLRLKGQGIRRKGKKEAGNQVARLLVTLPEEIDGDVEEALIKWEKLHAYDPRKKLRS